MAKPLRLPKDSVFCTACLRIMDKRAWDKLVTKDMPCTPGEDRCRRSIAAYSDNPFLYKAIRFGH